MSKRTIGLLLIAVVALGAVTGVAAADGHLEVAVDKDADGTSTVTVTENDTAVENAAVNVSVVDPANESYAGAGEYETDANGTVELPAPEGGVTVEVTAASGNETASTTVDLEAPDGLELDVDDTDGEPVVTVTDNDTAVENASVNVTTVDENASYAGEGDYETDANGTVELPAAEEDVTIGVTAEYENESASTTVDLTTGEEDAEAEGQPFGQLVREFIEDIEDREGGIGAAVSDFVTENNPGNAPEHAGGPGGPDEADGDDDAENESDAPGNGNAPDHAGSGADDDDGERGPPDHAGPGGDDADDDAENDDADDDDAEDDDADDDAEDDDAEEDDAEDGDADEDDDAEDDDAEDDDADEDDAEEDDADEDDAEDDGERGPPDHAGGPGGN